MLIGFKPPMYWQRFHPFAPLPPDVYENWHSDLSFQMLPFDFSPRIPRRTSDVFVIAALDEDEQSKNYLARTELQQKAMEYAVNKTRHLLIDPLRIVFEEDMAVSRGSYGEVWHCSLSRMGCERRQQVALKRIHLRPGDVPSKSRLLRHLLREVVPWHELRHPNITPFIGYTFTEVFAELVSEWEPNGSLRENMPQSPADGLRIAHEVASGLAYLHGRSSPIIHGDIKPENILIGKDGVSKLVDFGLSVILEDALNVGLRSSDGCRHTPLYADPTLLNDEPRTIFTDIWALGWVVYEMVTLRLPYHHVKSRNAKLFAIARYDVPKPSTHRLEYPDVIWPLLEASWSKDNSSRWSAKKMASHLQAAMSASEPPR